MSEVKAFEGEKVREDIDRRTVLDEERESQQAKTGNIDTLLDAIASGEVEAGQTCRYCGNKLRFTNGDEVYGNGRGYSHVCLWVCDAEGCGARVTAESNGVPRGPVARPILRRFRYEIVCLARDSMIGYSAVGKAMASAGFTSIGEICEEHVEEFREDLRAAGAPEVPELLSDDEVAF